MTLNRHKRPTVLAHDILVLLNDPTFYRVEGNIVLCDITYLQRTADLFMGRFPFE